MYEDGEYYYSGIEVFSSGLDLVKKSKEKNKKRFSDEQVGWLESIFESETKLEPKKKLEVAKRVGLQPRQVAIWFQNKRARYKSKQLKQEYAILMANCNALESQFRNLKEEKHSLLRQLQKLKYGNGGCNGTSHDKKLEETEKKENGEEWEENRVLSMQGLDYDEMSIRNKNDNEINKNNYIEDEMLSMSMCTIEGVISYNNTVQESVGWHDYSDHQLTVVDSCDHWWDLWSNSNFGAHM